MENAARTEGKTPERACDKAGGDLPQRGESIGQPQAGPSGRDMRYPERNPRYVTDLLRGYVPACNFIYIKEVSPQPTDTR